MNSLTESHMRIGLARDIEPLGVGELRRVAIGGAVEHRNGHMWAQVRAAQFAFLIAMPPGSLHGAVPAQHLLDGAREQRGVAAQQLKLLGMTHPSSRFNDSASCSRGFIQSSAVRSFSTTGMRLWISAIAAFAAHVTMVKVTSG